MAPDFMRSDRWAHCWWRSRCSAVAPRPPPRTEAAFTLRHPILWCSTSRRSPVRAIWCTASSGRFHPRRGKQGRNWCDHVAAARSRSTWPTAARRIRGLRPGGEDLVAPARSGRMQRPINVSIVRRAQRPISDEPGAAYDRTGVSSLLSRKNLSRWIAWQWVYG